MRYPESILPVWPASRPAIDPRERAARAAERSGKLSGSLAARGIRDARGWTWHHAFVEWCRSEGHDPDALLARA